MMAYDGPIPGSRKRKRRRNDKPAASARLFLDGNLRGEIGVLSADLAADLFPYLADPVNANGDAQAASRGVVYAAVTPWTPNASAAETGWAILPFRAPTPHEKALPGSTIRFPALALGTQSFVHIVHAVSPTKTLRQNSTVEVKISDVLPLSLDTVFVAVDTLALARIDDYNKRYGGGFGTAPAQLARKVGKRATSDGSDDALTRQELYALIKGLVSDALKSAAVVHTDDMLPLALRHPVTHSPAPPAKVLACEPVSQGLVSSNTNIVIVPSDKRPNILGHKALLSPRLAEESGDEEDTSNEAFFSAAEDSPAKPIVTSKSATDVSNSDSFLDSSAEESDLSDDSDDMISLAKPGLAEIPSGISSAITSATPRPFAGRMHGISSPTMSVFSNLTATTIRGGQAVRSKIFKAQGLYERIANELLYPKPPSDEDEEARVYIDAAALARLGCFSGDWVKIEAAENSHLPQMSAFSAFDDSIEQVWRPAKVYTLPESMTKRATRFQVTNAPRPGRRDSISSFVSTPQPAVTLYLSPILLANLQNPSNISLSALPQNKRLSLKRPLAPRPGTGATRLPPTASEVILRKIITPISTERSLNKALYANLKQYFEDKQRIVKPGDLIAIPVDESLGRSVYEGEVEQDGSNASALLAGLGTQNAQDGQTSSFSQGVAWFSVEAVSTSQSDDLDGPESDSWGNAALIDPSNMTMRQSGDDRRKLPSASNNPWQYYLGVRKLQPKSAASAPGPRSAESVQPYVSALQRRVRQLISVSISPRAVHMRMPPLAILMTSTQRNIGKTRTVQRACADLGVHFFHIDAHDIVSEGSGAGVDVQTQGLLEARCERAMDCGPEYTAICISHLEVFNAERAATSLKTTLENCRVLVATTTDLEKVPDAVRGLFTHELEMTAPDEGEREGILRDIVADAGVPLALDVDLSSIAVKTAALVAGDLADVVDRAIVAKADRLNSLAQSKSSPPGEHAQIITVKDIQLAGGASAHTVTPADFEAAVDLARKNFADSIGAPKIPNVQWSDVGGLTHVKDAVIETIQLPLSRPELFAEGLKKRSGILFYGPPGTGKTLLAKAIATEFSLNFFSVKGPELLNMYIGESEANVRRVFQRARDARPCVVFFDELDSVAPKRGNQGDSGGVMDRIVSQLLAELDGMSDGEENGGGVFVIGATNRPDLLDQALLRPGRFDKMLYLGISDTHDKQATILQALTRKFNLDPQLSLPRVAQSLPFTFTGADLYALCSDAMLKAVTRSARSVDDRVAAINADRSARGQSKISVAYYFDHYAEKEETIDVLVTEQDFLAAKSELVPSVSYEELRHYETVRANFEGVTKKSDSGSNAPAPATANGPTSSPSKANAPLPPFPLRRNTGSRSKLQNLSNGASNGSGGPVTSPLSPSKRQSRTNSIVPASSGLVHDADADVESEDELDRGDDDAFVVRTERLAVSSNAPAAEEISNGNGSLGGKGKGKGKMAVGVEESKGEDLYD